MTEEQLQDYLLDFSFTDVSEAEQDMTIIPYFEDGTYSSCEADWDSTDHISDHSTKLLVSLGMSNEQIKDPNIKENIKTGSICLDYVFPIKGETATAQVHRIVERLLENGCPTDPVVLTHLLTDLEREAQARVMDTLIIRVDSGVVQSVKGDVVSNIIILDGDTEGIVTDEDELENIDGESFYRYQGITHSELDSAYLESVTSQLKN
ncbi:hypothetical protein ACQR3P_28935 [Rhodococcus sp. IEGM1300]